MAEIASIRGDWPEVTIRIETEGRLNVRNVGRLLQSLHTAARASNPENTSARVELASIASGSLEIVIALTALGVSATGLAFQIKEFFKSNTAAVRVGRDLIVNDNAINITIHGGTNAFLIGHQDIPEMEEMLQQISYAAAARPPDVAKVIRGPQEGLVYFHGGHWWVELVRRPGITIQIIDMRADGDPLRSDRRYRLVGEAHIAAEGGQSAFHLRAADQI